jgi:hypothetical protein
MCRAESEDVSESLIDVAALAGLATAHAAIAAINAMRVFRRFFIVNSSLYGLDRYNG